MNSPKKILKDKLRTKADIMDKKSVGEHTGFRLIVMTAVFVAATLAMSIVIPPIPIPGTHGNINLCDAGILVSALLLGPRVGGVVGALSGFLLDILTGYSNYSICSWVRRFNCWMVISTFIAKILCNFCKHLCCYHYGCRLFLC